MLTSDPWAITPEAHNSLMSLFFNHLEAKESSALAINRFAKNIYKLNINEDEEDGLEEMLGYQEPTLEDMGDGLYKISLAGIIGRKLSHFEKICGGIDTQDIINLLKQAEEDENIKGLLIDWDSPGGTVEGTPEAARRIAEFNKPLVSYTSGQMCSACTWLAAGSDLIYGSESSDIGSIGVYTVHVDTYKHYEQMGIKMDVIHNKEGIHKTAMYPGTELTEEQRAYVAESVQETYEMFITHMQTYRGNLDPSVLTGKTYYGKKAEQNGLIDGVLDFDEVVDEAKTLVRLWANEQK
jgi:signal peptide peptidase SppA